MQFDTTLPPTRPRSGATLWRLRLEFAALFLIAPILMAVVLPPDAMFPALFAVTGLGLLLLHMTPGFHWRELWAGAGKTSPGLIALVAIATALAGYLVMSLTAPHALFSLPLRAPQLMLMIALAYPVLSALPQEIVFRPLFFRRYADVLPTSHSVQIGLNAAVFSLAHLMYWSWIVAVFTFAGGLLFAWSYKVRGSFAEAVLAHSVAGVVLFALGMGVYFYSGNVTRPL
ncbi:MAG: CPBP family intramembrane metalloprotease [Rhodobacteraceae bacterium]|nr:CPBP family intramembrane metalloprotease [Paracoccaceae bacterium]